MTSTKRNRLTELVCAPLFSPAWLLGRALLLVIFYAACHVAGLREHVTFLSGTSASPHTSVNSSATLGVVYLVAYFGFVLVVPIFLIAATLLICTRRLFLSESGARDLIATGTASPAPQQVRSLGSK
jgi:hypothetical protein